MGDHAQSIKLFTNCPGWYKFSHSVTPTYSEHCTHSRHGLIVCIVNGSLVSLRLYAHRIPAYFAKSISIQNTSRDYVHRLPDNVCLVSPNMHIMTSIFYFPIIMRILSKSYNANVHWIQRERLLFRIGSLPRCQCPLLLVEIRASVLWITSWSQLIHLVYSAASIHTINSWLSFPCTIATLFSYFFFTSSWKRVH